MIKLIGMIQNDDVNRIFVNYNEKESKRRYLQRTGFGQ